MPPWDRRPILALEAPPGAGKTTPVPLALLDAGWTAGRENHILEPRRLVARRRPSAGGAQLRGEAVGESVGYRCASTAESAGDPIECVTTGLFCGSFSPIRTARWRQCCSTSSTSEAIDGDLALAFCLEAQAGLRPDLRLVVMSATMDAAAVASLLFGARTVRSEGRGFPSRPDSATIRRSAHRGSGDRRGLGGDKRRKRTATCWCFCPALLRFSRAQASLSARLTNCRASSCRCMAICRWLSRTRPSVRDRQGRRKIVLATRLRRPR